MTVNVGNRTDVVGLFRLDAPNNLREQNIDLCQLEVPFGNHVHVCKKYRVRYSYECV